MIDDVVEMCFLYLTFCSTVDLHANQIQGFFDIPLDNLHGAVVCANYFKDKKLEVHFRTISLPPLGSEYSNIFWIEYCDCVSGCRRCEASHEVPRLDGSGR